MGRAAAVGFLPTRAEPMTFWVSELWLYVEDTHSHIHSYSVAVRRLLLTYIEILSVLKTWVVCLLVTVADVRGKWLHRCAQCRAYSEHKVTWLGRLPSTFVSFFLLCGLFTTLSAVKPWLSRTESVNAQSLTRYSVIAKSWLMGTIWLWLVTNHARDFHVITHEFSLIHVTQTCWYKQVGVSNGIYIFNDMFLENVIDVLYQ